MEIRRCLVKKTPDCPRCNSTRTGYYFMCDKPELFPYYFHNHLKHGEYIEPIFDTYKKDNNILCLDCGFSFYSYIYTSLLTRKDFEKYLEHKLIDEESIKTAKKYWLDNRPEKLKSEHRKEKLNLILKSIQARFKKGRKHVQ